MINKTYYIHGFDCPSCASKVEVYLNKHPKIAKANIDTVNDKLIISFHDEELSIDNLLSIIKEVEEDEITISEIEEEKKERFFNKELCLTITRILIAVVIMILGLTVFKEENYFWISFGVHLGGLLIIGYDVYYKVIHHIVHLQNPIDEYLLMSLASIGAFLVASLTRSGDFFDSLMVLTLWQVGEIIEDVATDKSKDMIKEAMSLRIEIAHKVANEEIKDISPKELHVDDIVLVNKGEIVPVDGKIISGEALFDTSSLTGEFNLVSSKEELDVYSGYIVNEGSVYIRATKEYKDSAVSKIIDLISNSTSKKSKADHFVTKFARWYTPIIFISALLVMLIGGIITSNWPEYVILGLKVLVVGCPCAIVISIPLAYFSSIGLASKRGIIVKGANYLDKVNDMDLLITDKTGTLTKGRFVIDEIHPLSSEEELLEALYASECLSNHPIGKGIVRDIDISKYRKNIKDYIEYTGRGVSINYQGDLIISGSLSLMKEFGIDVKEVSSGLVIYVAKNSKYLGYVILIDEIKEESMKMVSSLKKKNIDTLLLSGDKKENVASFVNKVGIFNYQGSLLPEEKVSYLEKEKDKYKCIAYLGDGVNDAACIKEADVGFAMGAIGSDIAIENADIVLMNDNPYKVVETHKIAKIARRVAIFNIVFALLIKIGIEIAALLTSLFGHPEIIPMWVAILTDTGLTVVLIINSLLVLYRKID